MHNLKSLIIPSLVTLKNIICGIVFTIICLFSYIYISTNSFQVYFLISFSKILIILMLLIMLCTFVYILLYSQYHLPEAIFDEKGVWVKHFGFISWVDILEIKKYSIFSLTYVSPEFIGINVKDINKLYKQASNEGKLRIFWSKLFRYSPINLMSEYVTNDEILDFANQFMINEKCL